MLAEALVCLALNVYHEARGGAPAEQVAVAHVVMNRVEDDRFPDTVCGVILQGGETRRHRCQFSWYCDGKPDDPFEQDAWQRAKGIAGLVLEGVTVDPTGGALFYHAPYVSPSWAREFEETFRDDGHIYYRPERAGL